MAQMVEVECTYCGKRFLRVGYKASRYPNTYCGLECRSAHKRKRVIRTCANCGKQYETQPTHNLKYCTQACATQGQIGQERPYMRGRPTWITGLTVETSEIVARKIQAVTIPVPQRDILHQMYTEENRTLNDIAAHFGVTHGTASKWIRQYNLIRKRDLLTAELLQELTDAGFNHVQIAEMYNCDNGFVSKRAKALGVHHLHPKQDTAPEAHVLEHLYYREGKSTAEIAELFGVIPGTVARWFMRRQIPLAPSSCFGRVGIADDGHQVKSSLELQVDNWLSEHNLAHEYEPPISGTHYRADFLVNGYYIEIWGMIDIPFYQDRHDRKLLLYEERKLPLLSLYPNDFPDLDKLLTLLAP